MKIFKKIISYVLFAVTTLCLSGCDHYIQPSKYFELSAFTNNSDSDSYDSNYFYRNELNIFGADACCIYVPEGRHTVNGVDNYGGYYYMYPSATNIGTQGLIMQTNTDSNGIKYKATNPVYKSKDLVTWELCGAVDGTFSTRIELDDWAESGVLAPDVIWDPNSGKYFIYEQTNSKLNDDNPSLYTECPTKELVTKGGNEYLWLDRFYLGIYISDYPTGPFVPVTNKLYYGDENQPNLNGKMVTRFNPPINIRYDLGIDDVWGVLDAHPFFDKDGQLYMYFCHHVSSDYDEVNIWGMKMKDMITPDYSTMTWLIRAGYETVLKNDNWENAPWSLNSYDMGEEYVLENGNHGNGNEGALMLAKDYIDENGNEARRYCLCYSGGGYNNKYYDISQTISDNPLGPFLKPKQYASSIVGTSYDNDWCMGCGHGCIVESPSGNEMFILGWSHSDTNYDAVNHGRWYVVDKVHWVETEEYGYLLYGNGPTKSLQPRMYDCMDVKNIANQATISVSSKGKNYGTQYLNDELFVSHDYYEDWEFKTYGETTITLTFNEPKEVSSVLVYNTYKYDYAFSGLDYIEFDLAEKPKWYTEKNYVPVARVSNISFNQDFIGKSYEYLRSGCACLASFNSIKVNSITIKISKKIKSTNDEIRISDIVVLGK